MDNLACNLLELVPGDACRCGGFRLVQWWDANQIADRKAVVGPHPALVDPHLTLAQGAIEAGPGHTFHLTQQVVIQPLADIIFVDLQMAHLSRRGGIRASRHRLHKSCQFFPYTAIVGAVVAPARVMKPGSVMDKPLAVVWACTRRDARFRQFNHTNLMDVDVVAQRTRIKNRTLGCLTDNDMNRAASTAGTQNQL